MTLTPLEETKRDLDPYGTRAEVITRLAGGTVADISPSDEIVLRWHGLYRQFPPESEAFMLRLKLPEGALTAAQARVIAGVAESIGDGSLSLTTRQGLEFHGVKLASLPEAFATLEAAGLTTVGACGDQVRNVVGCPVAGVDPAAPLDTTPLARAITAAFLGNPRFANLPRKFKVALSACPCGCVPYDINDVGLPVARNAAGEWGYALLIGGGLSTQPVHADSLGVWLHPNEVLEVITALVEIFREHGNREQRNRARVKHLVAAHGLDWLRAELCRRLGRALTPFDGPVPAPARQDHLGFHAGREAGRGYLGIPVPVGLLSAAQVRRLADLAEAHGRGQIRLTHWQNLLLPDLAADALPAVREELAAAGLPVDDARGGRVVVCIGKAYCTRAITHTKEHLRPLLQAIDDPLLGGAVSLRVSGCPNDCGGHVLADIGLRGAVTKTDNGTEERFDLFVGGGDTAFARRLLTRQSPAALAEVITGLLRQYRADARDDESFSAFAQRVLVAKEGVEE